jgi:DNA-binding response OmpR family regulator
VARIKIIDDDVEFAENVAAVLKQAGHEVSMLDTTDRAIEVLVAAPPDLLILDLMFPGNPVAGFDLARQVRRRREIKGLPILMLTGVNQEFPMDFSAKDIDPDWMPVQDFIEKPPEPKRLLKAVQNLLAAGA